MHLKIKNQDTFFNHICEARDLARDAYQAETKASPCDHRRATECFQDKEKLDKMYDFFYFTRYTGDVMLTPEEFYVVKKWVVIPH